MVRVGDYDGGDNIDPRRRSGRSPSLRPPVLDSRGYTRRPSAEQPGEGGRDDGGAGEGEGEGKVKATVKAKAQAQAQAQVRLDG